MAKMSPTQRALKDLREAGYEAQVVEKWNQFSKTRSDLFGIIDILAIRHGEILGVQVTTTSHIPARVEKAQEEPRLDIWLSAGGKFQVWGYAKRGRGKVKKWVRKIVELV